MSSNLIFKDLFQTRVAALGAAGPSLRQSILPKLKEHVERDLNVSPRILRHEVKGVLKDLANQDAEIREMAVSMNTQPQRIRDDKGNLMLTPVLLGKAQCLHALVLLQAKE